MDHGVGGLQEEGIIHCNWGIERMIEGCRVRIGGGDQNSEGKTEGLQKFNAQHDTPVSICRPYTDILFLCEIAAHSKPLVTGARRERSCEEGEEGREEGWKVFPASRHSPVHRETSGEEDVASIHRDTG